MKTLPTERYLKIQLLYREGTPASYEPKFFRKAEEKGIVV